MWEALLAAIVQALAAALLDFMGQRIDAPLVVKDAQHDKAVEDEFDLEVNGEIAAGRAVAPGVK